MAHREALTRSDVYGDIVSYQLVKISTRLNIWIGQMHHLDMDMLSMMEGGVFHLCHVMLLEVFVSVLARVHCEGDADEKSKDLLGGSEQIQNKNETRSVSPGGIPHEFSGIANGIENHIEGVPQTNTVWFVKFCR